MPAAHSIKSCPVVYFIRFGKRGPIKIGYTYHSVRSRLASLQCGSPVELVLLGILPVVCAEIEAELHSRFADLHVTGEWFRPAAKLMRFIRSNAVPAEALDYFPRPKTFGKRPGARAAGRPTGKRASTQQDHLAVLKHREQGFSVDKIARFTGVHRVTIDRWIAKAKNYPEANQILSGPLD
jgi:hypothetical protein